MAAVLSLFCNLLHVKKQFSIWKIKWRYPKTPIINAFVQLATVVLSVTVHHLTGIVSDERPH